ncbi:monooxygenase [Pedobacter psychrotolerans]|nr:monooxygenase [Pedobacter psychrotolerans]
MPKSERKFPSKDEVIAYLNEYEKHYKVKVQRSVSVNEVIKTENGFQLETNQDSYECKVLISATGTWKKPFIPFVPGSDLFDGQQIHSANYKNPNNFKAKKVLVVGNGNSGAQILAEVSKVATATWAVQSEPEYLPDEVDGRVLFDVASAKYHAMQAGKEFDASQYSLGKIVMVPPVVEARERGALQFKQTFKALTKTGVLWPEGIGEQFYTIIWCTGFRSATDHLNSLNIVDEDSRIKTIETKSTVVPGLYLVGYGNWTGFASATLIGVGRSAKQTIELVATYLNILISK